MNNNEANELESDTLKLDDDKAYIVIADKAEGGLLVRFPDKENGATSVTALLATVATNQAVYDHVMDFIEENHIHMFANAIDDTNNTSH